MARLVSAILLCALACASLCQQCDEAEIVEALSVDSVCTTAYSRVTGTELLDSYSQLTLDIEAIYLCGAHCGQYFYEAVNSACDDEETAETFLQLHCACTPSRCPSDDLSDSTSYCAYVELLYNLTDFVNMCGNATQNCSDACSYLLQDIVNEAGCCLRSRFSSSVTSAVGYLRDGDDDFSVFGYEALYTACGVDYPDECEDAFDDDDVGDGALKIAEAMALHMLLLIYVAAVFTMF